MSSAYRDIVGLAKFMRASQLEWTMVRVAFLNDRPASRRLNSLTPTRMVRVVFSSLSVPPLIRPG